MSQAPINTGKADPEDLVAKYMRVTTTPSSTVLEVAVVAWKGAYDPYLVWHAYRRWPQHPQQDELEKTQTQALGDPRYFQSCTVCRTRLNVGHTDGAGLCHACATQRGAVF